MTPDDGIFSSLKNQKAQKFKLSASHMFLNLMFPSTSFPFKYDKPISVMACVDTRASLSILDPKILPENFWEPCTSTLEQLKERRFPSG